VAHQQKVAFSKGFMNLRGGMAIIWPLKETMSMCHMKIMKYHVFFTTKSMCVRLAGYLSHNGTDKELEA